MDDQRRDALLKEYSEVCENFRLLTEIRFKLLTFLPAATAITAVLNRDSLSASTCVVAVFGLAITIGIIGYNERNDQLYDELVGRAASIERSVGLFDGAFTNRPRPWLNIPLGPIDWTVDHRSGVGLIYASSVALWLFLFFAPILNVINQVWHLGPIRMEADHPNAWWKILALVVALAVTVLAVVFTGGQKRKRQSYMRVLAKRTVNLALSKGLFVVADDKIFIKRCEKLSNERAAVIHARARYYTTTGSATASHYLPLDSKEQMASQFIALLTDLPARWLLDCATNRRGSLSKRRAARRDGFDVSRGK